MTLAEVLAADFQRPTEERFRLDVFTFVEVQQPEVVPTGPGVRMILAQHRAVARAVKRHQRLAAEKAMAAHIEYLIQILDEDE